MVNIRSYIFRKNQRDIQHITGGGGGGGGGGGSCQVDYIGGLFRRRKSRSMLVVAVVAVEGDIPGAGGTRRFLQIGFNPHSKDVKWVVVLVEMVEKLQLIKEQFLSNGGANRPPIHVNDKKVKRFDYAYLEAGREYKLAMPNHFIN